MHTYFRNYQRLVYYRDMSELKDLQNDLGNLADETRASNLSWFFKTGPGDYGEGDKFLGIKVPEIRKIAKLYRGLDMSDLAKLIKSPWHEERLCALLILVDQFKRADKDKRTAIYLFYLSNTIYINNWDLVDLSCRDIVGWYIYDNPEHLSTLTKLAKSKLLWDRRIAVISTFYFVGKGDPGPSIDMVNILLTEEHDLIQKANGWVLREVGKRIDSILLVDYLRDNYDRMPRTTLRYAIERFPETSRRKYRQGKFD